MSAPRRDEPQSSREALFAEVVAKNPMAREFLADFAKFRGSMIGALRDGDELYVGGRLVAKGGERRRRKKRRAA